MNVQYIKIIFTFVIQAPGYIFTQCYEYSKPYQSTNIIEKMHIFKFHTFQKLFIYQYMYMYMNPSYKKRHVSTYEEESKEIKHLNFCWQQRMCSFIFHKNYIPISFIHIYQPFRFCSPSQNYRQASFVLILCVSLALAQHLTCL